MATPSQKDQTPSAILATSFRRAAASIGSPLVAQTDIQQRIEYISRNLQNRAGVRLVLSCVLAKTHRPEVDARKPYTEIGDRDAFSGRTYDEQYLTSFITEHSLPCNPTTAFLTPALRNRNVTLTPGLNLVGRPPQVYQQALQLLSDVQEGRVTADDVLAETIRCLLVLRDEQRLRMEALLAQLDASDEAVPLSSEGIVTLVEQHMRLPKSSRLLVLVVAAAYQAASANLGERALPLNGHNAADKQTGAMGDVEITLVADSNVITSYEMKDKRVTRNDIDTALSKVHSFYEEQGRRIDNYIFITTELIERDVQEYAQGLYEKTGGIEFVVLDCISFLRHFLHLFHRLRMLFLEAYQQLILEEPDSAVSQALKEAFLAMRRAAEHASAEAVTPSDDID